MRAVYLLGFVALFGRASQSRRVTHNPDPDRMNRTGGQKSGTPSRRYRAAWGMMERQGELDWKAMGNIAALVGVQVAMVVMFNQVNGRLDRMQAENNRRF